MPYQLSASSYAPATYNERRTIALKAIEATEKKYYENYLLHAKKSKNQQFKCEDEVWFHHPEKYGMVVMPNIKGRVTEVVSCNYYRVLYNTLEGTECTAICCMIQLWFWGDLPQQKMSSVQMV